MEDIWPLANELEPFEIPVASLMEVHEKVWGDITPYQCLEHWRRVMAADLSYPVILGPDGRLIDGVHRALKCISEMKTDIMAVRLIVMPEPKGTFEEFKRL